MKVKRERSTALRAFNALCAIVLLVAGLYTWLAGFQVAAVAALTCATVGVVIPVVMVGEGILDVLVGILEAILDGILAIVEGIAELISGLFG